ncbi:AmmeMemoRadiSam system radical SAM enzyme [Sulfurimonas sp. HSL-1716]|uniref:AmmeMemoRadiSam system radical SAM enzyme n=1 Tax=Hydrocurvibacter sulfurireducens TaxID=3131937 RepID=UPI0031F7F379
MKYYRYKDEDSIVCVLCKHYCTLKKDSHGICGINYNIDSKLVNKTYGHPSAVHVDPIEKKPLYHFLPGSLSFSLGTVGCNFRCPFCQNYSISQTSVVDESITMMPQDVVDLAIKHGCQSISYTYNEPTIWYPYAKDIGILAKEKGLKNVFVSSGYESHEVLEDMPSWLDAANIDLKSFSHDYYKKVLKTNLEGVLESLIEFAKSDIWLEITTLLIPGVNDSSEEIEKMAEFISTKLGREIPWHFSAFHPDYKMQSTPSTPLNTLLNARKIAYKHGIKYVYLGNIANDSSTYCPNCKEKLIDRNGFHSHILNFTDGKCGNCGYNIKGRWS